VPHEGFVTFRISHVEDANHFFIHMLSVQNLRKDPPVRYEYFREFDLEFQLYFSLPDNRNRIQSFKEKRLYAYQDKQVFKRIAILNCSKRDDQIVYEVTF
jgi:hypothetical protein